MVKECAELICNMQSDIKISVIVPHRCVDSILNQTFRDFELILVDDGSTDSSSEICDEYQLIDHRIIVYHGENSGVNRARCIGVEHSKGEYICFVDADDYLLPYYLETMLIGIGHDGDIAYAASGNDIIDNITAIRMLLRNLFDWGLPTKLYRRGLLMNEVLDTPRIINIGEDLIGNIKICLKAHNVVFVKCDGYIYTMNNDSVTHTRKFSLAYEEMFLSEVEKALNGSSIDFTEDLWVLKLRCWKNLVLHGIKVERNMQWVRWVIDNARGKKITIGDKIILNITDFYLTYLVLKAIEFCKSVIKYKCH